MATGSVSASRAGDEAEKEHTSFGLLDIVRLPPVLIRARMLVRCLDQQDKRWLQSFCLLTEVSLVMLQPPHSTWRSIPLLHAHVRQDSGSQAEFFELSTAVKTYNFRAKHDAQAAEWVRLISRVASVEGDNSALGTAEHLLQDWSEGRSQDGLLAAAASVMHHEDGHAGPRGLVSPGGTIRLAPRAVTSMGRQALALPPWSAVQAGARQHAALLSGDAAKMDAAGRQVEQHADAMLWWQTPARQHAAVDEEDGPEDRQTAVLTATDLLGLPSPQQARPGQRPPARLMPAVLQDAMAETSRDAPVVAAHALLLEAAALAGADVARLHRAVQLGAPPPLPPRKPDRPPSQALGGHGPTISRGESLSSGRGGRLGSARTHTSSDGSTMAPHPGIRKAASSTGMSIAGGTRYGSGYRDKDGTRRDSGVPSRQAEDGAPHPWSKAAQRSAKVLPVDAPGTVR